MEIKRRYPVALTIAGSDSGGGAGIQADIKTFSALGVYGSSVITAITAQNTQEVRAVEVLPISIIQKQVEAVFEDIQVNAVKTGMLPTPEIIELIASLFDRYKVKNIVVDPVLVATTGAQLSSTDTIEFFKKKLFKRAKLITPNIPEAEALTGIKIKNASDMLEAANIMLNSGCRAVLIKGGHLESNCSTDILYRQKKDPVLYFAEKIRTNNVHGTGCTLSSAITSYIALGKNLEQAIKLSKNYVSKAIHYGSYIKLGKGNGPINHFFAPENLKIIDK